MAVDETSARFERLEQRITELNETTRRALEQGRPAQAERSQESVQDILARLDPEERRLIEDHRAYEQYKRLRSRRIQEEEKDKLLKKAQTDSEEEETEEEDDSKPKAKPKAKAKPKPASRHPETEGSPETEPAPETKPKPRGGFFDALMKD